MIGSVAESKLGLQLLSAITRQDVEAAAKSQRQGSRVVAIAGPGDLPTEPMIRAMIEDVHKQQFKPWHDQRPPRPLLEVPPTPGTIAGEKTIDAIGVTEWTLSNGVRVIVRPTTYETDNVALLGTSPGGTATLADSDYAAARFADDVANVSGGGTLSAADVANALLGRTVEVHASIGETREAIHGSASSVDLRTDVPARLPAHDRAAA